MVIEYLVICLIFQINLTKGLSEEEAILNYKTVFLIQTPK